MCIKWEWKRQQERNRKESISFEFNNKMHLPKNNQKLQHFLQSNYKKSEPIELNLVVSFIKRCSGIPIHVSIWTRQKRLIMNQESMMKWFFRLVMMRSHKTPRFVKKGWEEHYREFVKRKWCAVPLLKHFHFYRLSSEKRKKNGLSRNCVE